MFFVCVFLCVVLPDRTNSEPVEDTDTTSFVAEFVRSFFSFLPAVSKPYHCCNLLPVQLVL